MLERTAAPGLSGPARGLPFVNYHWNWAVFWEPAPNGTGNYLDMLLTGLVLTIETAICAWIIALVTRNGHRGAAYAAVQDRVLGRLCLCRILRNMPLLVQLFLWFFVLPGNPAAVVGALAKANAQRAILYGGDRDRAVHVTRAWPNRRVPASTRCRAGRKWPPPRLD